uniref:Uncharacterized protein n=1 Tax=Accipiter nisus TaxID=211598 RepID=A0A8B9MUM2_9AVES
MVISKRSLPVLISNHKLFIIFSLPCPAEEGTVAEVKLRDDQYTLDHMRAFGMYNYLHLDSWYQDNVYYVDQFGRVMNLFHYKALHSGGERTWLCGHCFWYILGH